MLHRRFGRQDGASRDTNIVSRNAQVLSEPSPPHSSFLSTQRRSIGSLYRRSQKKFIILFVCCLVIVHVAFLRAITTFLFGPRGSPIGGVLGIFIDSQLRHYLFRRQVQRWMGELKEEGINLPADVASFQSNAKLKTLPNFALGQTLLRAARRSRRGVGTQVQQNDNNTLDPDEISSWIASSHETHVTISESPNAPPLHFVPKVSIQQQMRKRSGWCEPNWLCFRCLKAPNYGSYPKCSFVCGTCARDIICNTPYELSRTSVPMKLKITTANKPDTNRRLIPRIIHQTWYEDITVERYPQLVRLQNSWKNAGWEYRFYDDTRVEKYIETHFPSRFLRAFQSLKPGAYKADFFRYLVLMKDGGIYADVDVMLDASLDSFVTPTMGFFVPRDAVGEQVGENFCLWNGLIGSAPAHPFMIRAVERMINLVLNRADLYDMEREIICRNHKHKGETWKARIEPNLLLSGPCALGVAVNEVVDNDPVFRFDVGWGFRASHVPGDTLILALDKNDLGSLRLSDVERNIIVASTDMPGLTKDPIGSASKKRLGGLGGTPAGKRPPHYSLAGKGDWVWGTKYVYSDALTANEMIKFNII